MAESSPEPFHIKGTTWPGSETHEGVVRGLRDKPMNYFLELLSAERFNTIRVPIAHQSVLHDDRVPSASFDEELNPHLVDAHYQAALLSLVRAAAKQNMAVVVSGERLNPYAATSALWYDDAGMSEEMVSRSWDALTELLCSEWNVLGVDLAHEPLQATWGAGRYETDWDLAAARLGNRVLQGCPRWLIFVQGVQDGCRICTAAGREAKATFVPRFFAGENLANASSHPVRLSRLDKLVYSPHIYSPHAVDFPYFHDLRFPNNLPSIWRSHFLAARDSGGGAPMVITGLGGNMHGIDRVWQETALTWVAQQRLSGLFYGKLVGMTAGDEETILKADLSPDTGKLRALAGVPTTDIKSFSSPSPPPSPPNAPPRRPPPALPPAPAAPFPSPSPAFPPWPSPPSPSPSPPPSMPPPPLPAVVAFVDDLVREAMVELSAAPALAVIFCLLCTMGCKVGCSRRAPSETRVSVRAMRRTRSMRSHGHKYSGLPLAR